MFAGSRVLCVALGATIAPIGTAVSPRIELPAGTYVPEFRWSEAPEAVAPLPAVAVTPDPTVVAMRRRSLRPWHIIGAAIVILAAIASGLWMRSRPPKTVLERGESKQEETELIVRSASSAYGPGIPPRRDAKRMRLAVRRRLAR